MREPRAYADPYLAGVGLGLVLLAAYVVMGRGLGASGAFAATAAGATNAVAPARAAASPLFARYLAAPGPWRDWLLFELAGVAIGGFLSAVLARGCTSGLALTGGALLGAGSWLFIGAAFGAAYLVAPLMKRAWR